jgi:tight adherence protein C
MPDIGLTATLIAVFAFVALTTGSLVYSALERRSPVRRRVEALRPAMAGAAGPGSIDAIQEPLPAALRKIQAFIPRSPSDMTRLQRRLARAGYHRTAHAVWYGLAQIGFAVAGGLLPIVILGWEGGRLLAVLGVIAGFLVPSVVVERRIKNRQKRIRNGLPDALDLFIVCLEAGLSLDQAILKSAQEVVLGQQVGDHRGLGRLREPALLPGPVLTPEEREVATLAPRDVVVGMPLLGHPEMPVEVVRHHRLELLEEVRRHHRLGCGRRAGHRNSLG